MTAERGTVRVLVGLDLSERDRARIAAVSPALDVEHRPDLDRAAVDALDDPELEVLVGRAAPADPARTPRLRWLQVPSAGVDHLAGAAFWERRLVVTNARGVYAGVMAEYVVHAVLDVHQQGIRRRAQQATGQWPADETPLLGRSVRGRTIVVVGYGAVGGEVGRVCDTLGMRVIAVRARPEGGREQGFQVRGTGDPDGRYASLTVGFERLAEVAAEADVLAVTAPLTPRTRGLVSEQVLAALPEHAWVINVGRGAVIDEPALVRALGGGRLAGAALDVFEEEPLPPDSPLWRLPNVLLTPHVSGGDVDGWSRLTDLIVENLRRYLADEPLLNRVDAGRGY